MYMYDEYRYRYMSYISCGWLSVQCRSLFGHLLCVLQHGLSVSVLQMQFLPEQ